MIGEYNCPHKLYSRKICNNPCIRPEGCRLHRKKEVLPLCIKCGEKPTKSKSGRCTNCIGGWYVQQYYNRLRAQVKNRKDKAEEREKG